jgi:hypothetical protein
VAVARAALLAVLPPRRGPTAAARPGAAGRAARPARHRAVLRALGFLTRWWSTAPPGRPAEASAAYAVNVIGGILDLLAAASAAPRRALDAVGARRGAAPVRALVGAPRPGAGAAWPPPRSPAATALIVLVAHFESAAGAIVLRDHTATVAATGKARHGCWSTASA